MVNQTLVLTNYCVIATVASTGLQKLFDLLDFRIVGHLGFHKKAASAIVTLRRRDCVAYLPIRIPIMVSKSFPYGARNTPEVLNRL